MRIRVVATTVVSLLVTQSIARRNIIDNCPYSCGANDTTLWVSYHSTSRLTACNQTMLLDFTIHNALNDTQTQSTIYACTTDGTDANVSSKRSTASTNTTDVSLEVGTWGSSTSTADTELLSVIEDVAAYMGSSANDGKSSTIFGYNGNVSVGLYVGGRLERSSTASTVADEIRSFINQKGASDQMAIQYCGETSNYIVGLVISTDDDLPAVQQLVKTWSLSGCVTGFDSSESISSSLEVETGTDSSISSQRRSLHTPSRHESSLHGHSLHRRSDCSTVQVVSGDSCTTLVSECGITATEFYEYNTASDLCSTLAVGQYVCCSSGDLPDNSPQPYSNGTCYTYLVESGDTCSAIAAAYDITVDEIDSYNNNTWGWLGCDDLQAGENICLSTGDPPFPSAIENAVCGPQVPGTTANGTEYGLWATMNPCPLNACCDVWGECGITPEFCTQTESTTGNPGTAEAGTNGCISNCGTAITNDSDGPEEFLALGYFEAFNKDRSCLTMDVYSIDTSNYTHIVYAFGLIGSDYSISINDSQSDMFNDFLALDDVKRIVSFGGWDFSTSTDTYMIFRDGVTSANRDTLAQNLADFISTNGIDGVDFDWEYPGEPDIEGIPAGSDDDGTNYVAFLKALRSLIGDDITISIAMPASFWYLQAFPVSDLNEVVDFFIYMTYDLHGQWDYGNDSSDDGCVDGNCLRSHVNLTETNYALSMVTKGGAQTNKLMVGVTSYGRSFEMTTANCTGPDCTYTGPDSGATPGRCTQTAGYISNAEIDEIISTSSNVQVLFDDDSDSDIIVYNDTQWVGYMTTTTKRTRTSYYKGLNMGGTTEWAIDLEQFMDDPDGLVITNLSTDLTDDAQCDFPDQSEEASEEASSERNVAAYIDALLTSVIKEHGKAGGYWDKELFGDQTTECSSLSEDVNCDIPSSSECSELNEPSHYWARFVVANFRLYMNEYYDLFSTATLNATNKVEQLVADFPTKSPDVVDIASLLSNFGGALSLISGLTGDGLATTLIATASGIFSEASTNVDSDDDDDSTVELDLYNKISDIYTAFYDGSTKALEDMFDNADISSWPSSLISGTYTHDIANFFDGPFMYELSGTDQSNIEDNLNQQLFATLAGTALASANYYILKGAHTVSKCPDVTSGTIIDGYCYTLEYPGSGFSLTATSDFSDPIASDDLTKLTDTYYVELEELYTNSYKCQNSTGDYGGQMDSDLVLTASTTLPTCFYNLPVFTVESGGDVTSSPCLVLAYNESDSTAVLGVSYMPSNLADIFDDDFCWCNAGNRQCSL
ncbi:glycoside hydrolase [Penicillium cataractarum]|uniref:chitinase n=1 Tax=Penicillium cataractarum TaxID=2100454 RepID=A0A9W9SG01_9EURO|nr:glycoside hydrolase [Penicillium cataractarum]KAJ5377911.1 glycoside hydrolase [Penicillium cataractarum]